MPKTFTISATPVQVEQHDGYSSVRFQLFANSTVRDIITVESPHEIAEALRDWAFATPLPESTEGPTVNAWSVSVNKPSRWPAGYKQAGEQSHKFVVRS